MLCETIIGTKRSLRIPRCRGCSNRQLLATLAWCWRQFKHEAQHCHLIEATCSALKCLVDAGLILRRAALVGALAAELGP